MPKKKNFLGGMQNYNAQTGEYEPALKGPGGESPSGFKSFKKQEEKPEQPKAKYFKHPQVEGVWHDTGKTMDRGGKTYKVFENEEGNTWAVSEQFGKQFEEVNEPKHPFKLDKEKYPDVEETEYGFIYNVNGKSITDLKAQAKMFGEQIDGEKDYGFSLTQDGDEVYYDSFDAAYKAAKGK